jgi:hypothetical protein
MTGAGRWLLAAGLWLAVPRTASADVVVIYGDSTAAGRHLDEHCVVVPQFNSAWKRTIPGIENHLRIRKCPATWTCSARCPPDLRGSKWYDWVYDEAAGRVYRRGSRGLVTASSQVWLTHPDIDVRTSYSADVIRNGEQPDAELNRLLFPCSPCRAYHRVWASGSPDRAAVREHVESLSALLTLPDDPTDLMVRTFLGEPAMLRPSAQLEHANGTWTLVATASGGASQPLTAAVEFTLFDEPEQCRLEEPEVPAWPTKSGWLAATKADGTSPAIPFKLRPKAGGKCVASGADLIVREPALLGGDPGIAPEHRALADVLLHWPKSHLSDFVSAYARRTLRRSSNGKWSSVQTHLEIRIRDRKILESTTKCDRTILGDTTWSVLLCPSTITLADFEGAFRWY